MRVRSILLIDDDDDDQFVFGEALHSVNTSVALETAKDGIDALHKLDVLPALPQLIFLDLNMPRMNGKTFFERNENFW